MNGKAESEIIAESSLRSPGTLNFWSDSRIKKYLRHYSLGAGLVGFRRAKNRYRVSDVRKAYQTALDTEPKDEHGLYVNETLRVLQCENSL